MKWFSRLFSLLFISTTTMADEVSRSVFALDIADREPVDITEQADTYIDKLYFFTELNELAGETVTHRWNYAEEVMAEVSFEVGSDRWRVWSSKNMVPGWSGSWQVDVVSESGEMLRSQTLLYGESLTVE